MSRHAIEPRGLTLNDALHYLGVSASWFSQRRDELVNKLKFPRPHPVTNRYDRKQIDAWHDKTLGVKNNIEDETEELLRKIKNGDI